MQAVGEWEVIKSDIWGAWVALLLKRLPSSPGPGIKARVGLLAQQGVGFSVCLPLCPFMGSLSLCLK